MAKQGGKVGVLLYQENARTPPTEKTTTMKNIITAAIIIIASINSYASTVWNGQVSNEWSNASNWSAGVPDATSDAVIAASSSNNASVSGSATCHAIEIAQGGVVEIASGAVLNVYGDIINNGNFDASIGKVNFAGVSHISDYITFNDITINGTLYAPSSVIDVRGTWENNGVFINGMGSVQFSGQTNIIGSAITSFYNVYVGGEMTSHPIAINVKGNFMNNGTFHHNNGTVVMNGNTNQSIGIGSVTEFYNLAVSNPNYGVCMTSDIIINNKLSLMSGYVNVFTYTLIINNNDPKAVERMNGFVISETIAASGYSFMKWNIGTGKGTYIYPFATNGNHDYVPVTVEISAPGMGNGSLEIATYRTDDANNPYPTTVTGVNDSTGADISAQAVDRFWISRVEGFTVSPVSAISFTASESEIGFNNDLVAAKWNGASWISASSSQEHLNHGTRASDMSDYSIFMLVDENGVDAAPVISGVQNNQEEQVKIYPTAISSSESIHVKGIAGSAMMQVIDMQGRVVMSQSVDNNASVSMSDMASGMYFAQVVANGQMHSEKIVVAQ